MVSKTFKLFLCTILLISIVGFSMSFVSATDVDANGVVDSAAMIPVSGDSANPDSDDSSVVDSTFIVLDSVDSTSSDSSVPTLKESGVSSDVEKLDDNENETSSTNVNKFVDDNDNSKFLQGDHIDDVKIIRKEVNDYNPNVATAIAAASFAKDTASSTINIVSSAKNNVYSTIDDMCVAVSDVKSNVDSCIKSSNIKSILPYYASSLKAGMI